MHIDAEAELAMERRKRFVDSLPSSLVDQEDSIPKVLAQFNASPRSKLNRIYKLVDRIAEVRATSPRIQ